MSLDLASLESTLTGLVPSSTDILQSVATTAAAGVVVAGLKNQIQTGALDPLGLFHTAAPATQAAAPVSTTTITASAWAALSPAMQAQLMTGGVHIVAG